MSKKVILSLILIQLFASNSIKSMENSSPIGAHIPADNMDIEYAKNELKSNLYKACKKGYLEKVKLLIAAGADVNAKDVNDETPLHVAAALGLIQVAELIIDHDADVNMVEVKGETPLHKASRWGKTKVAHLLLSKFILPNTEKPSTPFINGEKKEIWDLKSLALMNLLNTIGIYDEKSFNETKEYFGSSPSLLNSFEKILPYINLHQDEVRKLIALDKKASKTLTDFCKQKHFQDLKNFIAIKSTHNNTALDEAKLNNREDCYQLFQAVHDAQCVDDFPYDLKLMIEENIEKKLVS